MKAKCLTVFLLPFYFLLFTFVLGLGWSPAWAGDLPNNATFTTLITTPLVVEGLTGDNAGNLYTTGRGGNPCPVWRINLANPALVVVGNVTAPCSPSGIAFNDVGDLFLADGNNILTFTPNAAVPPTAVVYATGVPGTNGIAFDKHGNLWTGDGTAGQGRVWKIAPCGTFPAVPCAAVEMFRIQPMATTNVEIDLTFGAGQILGSGVTAVGRDARTLPPGLIDAARAATNILGSQPLVANGVAFDKSGDLFVADTARGAIWRVKFNKDGSLKSKTGCDEVFTDNTLCLDNIYVAHPLLEGTDGIALDKKGNIWNSANERNAIVVVTRDKKEVVEVFRNDPDTTTPTYLRNGGPLEFPSSPFLLGKDFCTANSDNNRRDNSPNTAGEIKPAGPDRGKIACMDQDLKIPGLPLPVD